MCEYDGKFKERVEEIDNDVSFPMPVYFKFTAQIRKIKLKNGGGWHIEVPELGTMAYCACGETPYEAIKTMEEFGKWLLLDNLQRYWDKINEIKEDIEAVREEKEDD